jgi:hypothetical protein
MTDFGILLASPHNPIGCINWFEHPRVYGRISFTGDCTPHTKLYSQVTQTTFFGHDLFANLSAAWHLGQLLALYSRLAPAITNAWCCQKKSSRILETKFLAFPLALTLASFQGWFGVGSNMSKFFKAYCLIIIIMYDGFTIESVPFFFGMPASEQTQPIGCRPTKRLRYLQIHSNRIRDPTSIPSIAR